MKTWMMIPAVALAWTLSTPAAFACNACGCSTEKTAEHSHDEMNLVERAAHEGSFGTLLAAAEAAGLAETLSNDGPFTILAPTDEAFAALPDGTVESLLDPGNKELLKSILLYHVIEGEAKAETVVTLDEAETLEGNTVAIEVTDDGVTINGANVIATDVTASNGVIHVIDAVLLPPAETASAE